MPARWPLRALGVAVALDNFGTGYSSLAHLQQLPLDMLKIDRSFVAGLGTGTPDTEIVRSLLALARALGVEAVAEGVETGSQLARLAALGCGLVQGYRVAPPAPAAAVTAKLRVATSASG